MKTNILVQTENLTTEEWLRWRQKGIGGSDVAPILGIAAIVLAIISRSKNGGKFFTGI